MYADIFTASVYQMLNVTFCHDITGIEVKGGAYSLINNIKKNIRK